MRLEELAPNKGSKKKVKRVGRGPGSGHGGTSCKGNKGQLARSGGGKGPQFEGGQLPLARRLPKFGFKSPRRKDFSCINVSDLNVFENNETVNPETLIKKGLVRSVAKNGIKILGNGELTKTLTVCAHKFTKSAQEKIESSKGKIEVI